MKPTRSFNRNTEIIKQFSGDEEKEDIFAEGYCGDCGHNPCQCKEREDYED